MLTLITGASAGLGAEMARQFADLRHDLVLTARRVDRLEELRGEILAGHPKLRVEVAGLDVTDEEQVFEVFRGFAPLDRVIVNAGVGGGKIVGTGGHAYNVGLAKTNFVAALVQIEAAMEQFRAHGRIAHLVECLRSEMLHSGLPITITTVYPGYIRSEMTADQIDAPFKVDTQTGVCAIVSGIEGGKATVFAPRFPWQPSAWRCASCRSASCPSSPDPPAANDHLRRLGRSWRYVGSVRTLAHFRHERLSLAAASRNSLRVVGQLGYFARNAAIKLLLRRGHSTRWLGWAEPCCPYAAADFGTIPSAHLRFPTGWPRTRGRTEACPPF
jgi:short-subunit dehydrogenase